MQRTSLITRTMLCRGSYIPKAKICPKLIDIHMKDGIALPRLLHDFRTVTVSIRLQYQRSHLVK